MREFADSISIMALRESTSSRELRWLLDCRIREITAYVESDLAEIVKIYVADPHDELQEFDLKLGFSLLSRNCDAAESHLDWFELTFVLSDSGFGVVIYVPKHADTSPELLAYCEKQSERSKA